jgi:membrane protein DedA with SNARE-associated domain
MPEEVVYYVTRYGYIAIFIMVFLQEIGMPNPFPNELLLIFSGYLSFKGILFFPFVILIAITADFIGTNILYTLFYNVGPVIIKKKPKWIPLSAKTIDNLTAKILNGGLLSIYIFRLTPFTRGYTSVITGLLGIKPRVFLPIALISAATWATIYVLLGYFIGPSWDFFTINIGRFKFVMLSILILVLFLLILFYYFRKRRKIKKNRVI